MKQETPESIKNLSREQLEKLCLSAMSSENKATHRANYLEDLIDKIYGKSVKILDYYDRYKQLPKNILIDIYDIQKEIEEDDIKYKGSDE